MKYVRFISGKVLSNLGGVYSVGAPKSKIFAIIRGVEVFSRGGEGCLV